MSNRFWVCLVALSLIGACSSPEITVPHSDAPFLYLVLNRLAFNPLHQRNSPDAGQYAILLTVGNPTESPVLRRADRFEMRAGDGGSPFNWRPLEPIAPRVGSYPHVDLDYANYFLPDTSASGLRGADSLTPGKLYSLVIETGGVRITGESRIPHAFSIQIIRRSGRRVAVWPTVEGAGGYRVYPPVESGTVLQTDTVFVLAESADATLKVEALDLNLWDFATNSDLARAGIDAGFGVFGAISTARIER